jgi:hypothetical protein
MSCLVCCLLLSCLVLSCLVCLHDLSCVLSCLVLSCLVCCLTSYVFLSLSSRHVLSSLFALCCLGLVFGQNRNRVRAKVKVKVRVRVRVRVMFE